MYVVIEWINHRDDTYGEKVIRVFGPFTKGSAEAFAKNYESSGLIDVQKLEDES